MEQLIEQHYQHHWLKLKKRIRKKKEWNRNECCLEIEKDEKKFGRKRETGTTQYLKNILLNINETLLWRWIYEEGNIASSSSAKF